MKVNEYQAKEIFSSYEIPVERRVSSHTPDEAIAAEYYLGFTIDCNTRSVTLIARTARGTDIEYNPEKIFRYPVDPFIGIPDYLARRIAYSLFSKPALANRMAKIIQSLYKAFIDKDASLAEINPLVLTDKGTLIANDAKMVFDDNALFRHPDIQALFETSDDEKLEIQAKERGFSYVGLNGDIGCMVNGAGLAMTTMDMIKQHGGSPANFLDIGGSSDPVKVIEAMKFLLDDENVKVALVNIFGGITRCDDIAIGLIQAFDQIDSDVPVIVRLTGTNEHIGRGLLRGSSRFQVAETMSEAVHMALESLKIERRS